MAKNLSPIRFVKNAYRLIWTIFILSACSGEISSTKQLNESELGKVKVVATTSIIFDIVSHVGGNSIDLDVLLPSGVDPHSFEPAPQDIAKLSNADILFINGAGLETFLNSIIESSGGDFRVVDLSEEIQLISLVKEFESEDEYTPGGFDPHIWMDPNNVIIWVNQISEVLSKIDVESSPEFKANAQAYIRELENLDRWIVSQVEQIPPQQRKLVTDHLVFSYFARAYNFVQVGAVLPAFSNQSQTSAKEIANLEDTILKEKVKAILVGVSVNPDLARRVAEDTGVQIVFVYFDTLTESGGLADSYIELIRYDVDAIVTALR
jgi:ABC-type Zn uptake system ZnuABC Zn-binding protein ZnuA